MHPKIKKEKKHRYPKGLVAAAGGERLGSTLPRREWSSPAIAPRGAPHCRSTEPPPNSGCASILQGEEGRRKGIGPGMDLREKGRKRKVKGKGKGGGGYGTRSGTSTVSFATYG